MILGKSGVTISRTDDEWGLLHEVIDAMLPGKAAKHKLNRTVPQTDTGRQVENTKALERTWVKELGKMVP